MAKKKNADYMIEAMDVLSEIGFTSIESSDYLDDLGRADKAIARQAHTFLEDNDGKWALEFAKRAKFMRDYSKKC